MGGFFVLELLLFPAATGAAFAIHSLVGKNKTEKVKIKNLFKDLGVGAEKGKGKNKYVVYPRIVNEFTHKWGTSYAVKLPTGFPYPAQHVVRKFPLDLLLADMLQTDVDINEKNGLIIIDVYKERLTEYVEYQDEWMKKCKNYRVIVGVNQKGLVMHSFKDIPHMIMGGMTTYGKSVLMKLIITQLVMTHQSVKFHLFDLKGGLAFNRFKKLPQVHSVSRNVDESLRELKNIRNEIIKRQKWFEQMEWENITEAEKAGYLLGRDIIIVDEASVLAPQNKSDQKGHDIHKILEFIAQVAGQLGFNLIMCSQYPTGDILPRQVKQNADAKIALRLPTSIASKVILDENGAEDLEHGLKGRAIYRTDTQQFIQVPYLSNERIDKMIGPLKVVKDDDIIDQETRNDADDVGEVALRI